MITVERNSEIKLLEILKNIQGQDDHICAVHFFFSKLSDKYKSKYQVKIAINIITDVFGSADGCIFLIHDLDVFALFHVNDKHLLDKAVYQLRHLFIEDPLTREDSYNHSFFNFYDLTLQFQAFFLVCNQKLKYKNDSVNLKSEHNKHLSALEQEVLALDISSLLNMQSICAVVNNQTQITPIFDALSINLSKLYELLGLKSNLIMNAFLSRYLINILDKSLLDVIHSKPKYYFQRSISVLLSVDTILSQDFLNFHHNNTNHKLSVVVEIDIIEFFIDADKFLRAKDLVMEYGYRVSVTNIKYINILQFCYHYLDMNLIKLDLNNSIFSQSADNIIGNFNPKRTILSNCQSLEQMQAGCNLGFVLFQGPYLEHVITKCHVSKVNN